MILKKDQYVVNAKMTDWGVGKVIDIINQDRAEVFFEHGGYHTFVRKKNSLTQVDPSEVNTDIFDHININALNEERKSSYRDIPSLQKYFLQEFPGGFNGDKYHAQERDYKDAGHVLAIELLNQESFKQLLQANNYEEIITRALNVVNKLNLMFPNEKMALKDRLKKETAQEQFAHSLYSLLYGTDDLEGRFQGWIRTLVSIGADKWPTASYFLFIVHPDKYMFIKPTIIQAVADMSSFPIAYTPSLNWNTYNKILKFSEYLKQRIHELEPKDMIDVQSFMWCIMRFDEEK